MVDYNVDDLATRIQRIYNSCPPEEQEILMKILEELAIDGTSRTYQEIWLADYKEIPVDIVTFMCSDTYLGKANRQGTAVYPFWMNTLTKIFTAGNMYEELIFTGATRIGKSSTAIAGVAYMLYKLMCLRDPQTFYNKKEISKFSILFFNITKDLARGVAYREFNDLLATSPWFNMHGEFSRSDENFYYIPEGGKVIISYGSSGSHALGQQVFCAFCLVGTTEVVTNTGIYPIQSLVGQHIQVEQLAKDGSTFYTPAKVCVTGVVDHTIRVTCDDGSTIEGTHNHLLMVHGNAFKRLDMIELGDMLRVVEVGQRTATAKVVKLELVSYDRPILVYDVVSADPYHNFTIQSKSRFVSHNCDEMNFTQAGIKDVVKAKSRMKDTYNTISARVKGTFRKNGQVHGKIFAVSSKKSDSDFLEMYVEEQMRSGAGDHMYVAEGPQWDILPPGTFSDERFYVAVGNRHQRGFVVPDNQSDPLSLADIESQGFRLLNPPVDMRPEFIADFDIALRDLAGISVPGALSFITQDSITACISTTRRNPFFSEVLSVGTKDNMSIIELFHQEVVPAHLKRFPMFIHIDLSLNTDKTGISGVVISGRRTLVDPEGKSISVMELSHIFSCSIEAPRGDKIPYQKITEFICWLRRSGYNIDRISRDQFQSEYMAQLLEAQGFTVDKLSLDRTPDGYQAFRSLLLEQRLDLLDYKLVQDELICLQRDALTGKIDHPVGGCFTGDTQIRLADGRDVRIEDLMDMQHKEQLFVPTVNEETGQIETKRVASVFFTKVTDVVQVVHLTNGQIIMCTPDHRFMLDDCSYEEIQYIESDYMLKCSDPYAGIQVACSFTTEMQLPVYDMEVDGNHNFLLSAGVFVHNSKDVADSLAGACWNATLHNPGIPIESKTVAKTISAINGSRSSNSRYTNNGVLSPFPGYTKR